jgi:predicted RNA-binding Zn-ribbon protein involved in translation (DUF1610 family)
MDGPNYLMEHSNRVRFCDSCGKDLQRRPAETRHLERKTCVSCGRTMDKAVYFTVCPHCGFNYRIEVSQIDSAQGLTLRNLMPSFLVSAAIACATLLLLLLT